MESLDALDSVQYYEYRRRGIHFQEELFGKTFVYVGGKQLTTEICKNASLSAGQKVMPFVCAKHAHLFKCFRISRLS